ncbi:hypothetical protein MRX96_042045 [Rhipicephalus microplus]
MPRFSSAAATVQFLALPSVALLSHQDTWSSSFGPRSLHRVEGPGRTPRASSQNGPRLERSSSRHFRPRGESRARGFVPSCGAATLVVGWLRWLRTLATLGFVATLVVEEDTHIHWCQRCRTPTIDAAESRG